MAMKRRTRNLIFRVYIPLALLAGLVAALIWGFSQKQNALRYQSRIEEQYAQAFDDLADNFSRMETALSKLTVTGSKDQTTLLLSEVWRTAGACSAAMTQIPAGYESYSELNTFLTRIGDYAHTLLERLAKGGALGRQDIDQIATLHASAAALSSELQKARESGLNLFSLQALDSGQFWSATEKSNALVSPDTHDEAQNTYPQLIYDGPFSDSVAKAEPRGLGHQIYDAIAAREVARIFLADTIEGDVEAAGEQNGRISAFLFRGQSTDDRRVEIAVTKQGGQVLWMRVYEGGEASANARENVALTPKGVPRTEALATIGQGYLREKGFDAMEPRYWQAYGGAIVVNYVYVQNGVMVYNDQIKLWIETATGRVVGFDAENYLFSHVKRSIPSATLSVDDAKAKLAAHLEVKAAKRAFIPVTASDERLCYEFRVAYQEQEYLIYINATTGREEQILKFVDSAAGRLLL